MSALRFLCTGCWAEPTRLEDVDEAGWRCPRCGQTWTRRGGIVRALPREALNRYAGFFEERRAIRQAEGRGGAGAAYYLELPFPRGGGPAADQWPRRARTYRFFLRQILRPVETAAARPLRILDLGAGSGWLSYRLAERGHEPVAVDLLDDDCDGLGAARYYDTALRRPFVRIQAELDRIPLVERQFDLAVFNASFHYAADYRATLREARRMLGWSGQVVILDTPVFASHLDGERMREERQAELEERYRFRCDSLLSMEYLDERMLRELSRDVGVRWRVLEPWRGLLPRLDALRAWLGSRRPPERFKVLTGKWIG